MYQEPKGLLGVSSSGPGKERLGPNRLKPVADEVNAEHATEQTVADQDIRIRSEKKRAKEMPNRSRFASDYTQALRMEGHSEALLLLAALFGILAVAYADSLVVTISLGYLYVLPLSLAALTQYRRTAFSLAALCVLLHDWLGPYEYTGKQLLYVSLLSSAGFFVVVLFVGKLADQRRRLMHVVSAQRHELELELTQAAEVQQRLLPHKAPSIPGMEIAGLMSPSKELGGDYYDYIPFPEGVLGLVIADVSGKGTEAALFMPSIEVALRMDSHAPSPTHEIVSNLNKVLYELTGQSRYVTLFYAKVDISRQKLEYTNAGHFPPMLLRGDEPEMWLTEGGTVVGLLPLAEYRTASIVLNPGDVMILYTDGVIEAENEKGEIFTTERLIKVARANQLKTAQELLQGIYSAVLSFSGTKELHDDLTIVVFKVLPENL
jgi:serine phosphatase RsbU (regulator of sigma subunit)